MRKKYILLFFIFITGHFLDLNAQIKIDFRISAFESFSSGISIQIIPSSGGRKIKTQGVSSSGTCTVKLAFNDLYTVRVEKNGFVSKIIEFNTDVSQSVIDNADDFPKKRISIILYPQRKDVDVSLFSRAIIRFSYDREMDDFVRDTNYDKALASNIQIIERKLGKSALVVKNIDKKSIRTVKRTNPKTEPKLVKSVKQEAKIVGNRANRKVVRPTVKKKIRAGYNPQEYGTNNGQSSYVYPLVAITEEIPYAERILGLNIYQKAIIQKEFDDFRSKAQIAFDKHDYLLSRYFLIRAKELMSLEEEELSRIQEIELIIKTKEIQTFQNKYKAILKTNKIILFIIN
jgi:hypothetical protein